MRLLVSVLAGAVLGLFAGCGSEVVAPVPPPVAPPSTAVIGVASAGQIVVTQAPPVVLQQEVIGARPSVEHVWVEGWWVWRDGRYEWHPGEWVVPPRRGAVWVAPRWERRDDGYYFVDGYWR